MPPPRPALPAPPPLPPAADPPELPPGLPTWSPLEGEHESIHANAHPHNPSPMRRCHMRLFVHQGTTCHKPWSTSGCARGHSTRDRPGLMPMVACFLRRALGNSVGRIPRILSEPPGSPPSLFRTTSPRPLPRRLVRNRALQSNGANHAHCATAGPTMVPQRSEVPSCPSIFLANHGRASGIR